MNWRRIRACQKKCLHRRSWAGKRQARLWVRPAKTASLSVLSVKVSWEINAT